MSQDQILDPRQVVGWNNYINGNTQAGRSVNAPITEWEEKGEKYLNAGMVTELEAWLGVIVLSELEFEFTDCAIEVAKEMAQFGNKKTIIHSRAMFLDAEQEVEGKAQWVYEGRFKKFAYDDLKTGEKTTAKGTFIPSSFRYEYDGKVILGVNSRTGQIIVNGVDRTKAMREWVLA